MWRLGWGRSGRPEGQVASGAQRDRASGSQRDRLAVLMAFLTVVCLGAGLFLSKGTQVLMPGPLASAHGAIEQCSACHAKSGSGKLSWIRGLSGGDPHADSKACITCHKMPDTAFNAHSASADVLKQSTTRLTKIAGETPAPSSARAQNVAFPAHDMVAGGLSCATCHQEHQGANFDLNKVSNEQCRSCHVVKFDSFDGDHPKFETYPFKRRTRIVYDHAGHFGKHYPEVAKKDPARRIPETCSTCHNSREDKRIMAVAPFEQTCTGCHLDQIVGKERASGPKGIAFLSVPGLDVQTLKKKNAAIGEWPDASEAELTPFMKVMIGKDERGRALMKTLDGLNLQDLSNASDEQIKAVTALVWKTKRLFHALIKGKASDVLGNFNIGGGAKLSAGLVADLTASLPRDVITGAQQKWLPNLAAEMAARPDTDAAEDGWSTVTTETKLAATASPEEVFGARSREARRISSDHQTRVAEDSSEAIQGRRLLPSGTPRSIDAERNKDDEEPDEPNKETDTSDKVEAKPDRASSPKDAKPTDGAGGTTDTANDKPADGDKQAGSAGKQPPSDPADQSDDLLFPTADELRGIAKETPSAEKASPGEGAGGPADAANAKPDGGAKGAPTAKADADTPPSSPEKLGADAAVSRKVAAPVISIESDVDPESWAEYGGWYRQDYAIFYRPTGHKDKFVYAWLYLTGPQAPKGGKSPAAAVFDFLTSKDAQGSCTKCHSVDDIRGKGRVVNFSPPSVESKRGRFTNFIHEPHFAVMENRTGSQENRGCLTCHSLEKGRPYLKGYEQGNPKNFVSNFGAVKKDLCQTCHTSSMARQDCLLCHQYHVNNAITPVMNTRLPAQ
jgi:hypothetical protein